jgi:hypothetical protein
MPQFPPQIQQLLLQPQLKVLMQQQPSSAGTYICGLISNQRFII